MKSNKFNTYMAMRKGHTNNPNGRPKGTPNKATTTMKDWINNFIDGHIEQIEEDFDCLDPKERLNFISKLLPYVVPKMDNRDEKFSQDSFKVVIE